MSQQGYTPPVATGSYDEASEGRTARVADQASQIATTAGDEVKHVAAEASEGVRAAVDEARTQAQSFISSTRDEVLSQAEVRTAKASEGLRGIATQFQAISNGRPEEAPQLSGYLREAEQRVSAFATRLDDRGPQGVMEDVTRFARRRPGAFLLCAAGVGFVAGRAVRAGAAASRDGLMDKPSAPVGYGELSNGNGRQNGDLMSAGAIGSTSPHGIGTGAAGGTGSGEFDSTIGLPGAGS